MVVICSNNNGFLGERLIKQGDISFATLGTFVHEHAGSCTSLKVSINGGDPHPCTHESRALMQHLQTRSGLSRLTLFVQCKAVPETKPLDWDLFRGVDGSNDAMQDDDDTV